MRYAKHAKSNGKPTTPDTPRDRKPSSSRLIHIGILVIGFTHYRDLSATSSKPTPPKRDFKLHAPAMLIPALGQLPQPFNETTFAYIQYKATYVTKLLVLELTANDVKTISEGMRDAKKGQDNGWLMF